MKTVEKKAIKRAKALLRFFLYALSGALCGLPIAFPSLWFIGWIAPVPVLYSELCGTFKKDSYGRAYLRGMSFFWFFGVVVFHWFSKLYPLDFLGFQKEEALFTVILAMAGIPLLQGAVSSLIFVLTAFLRRRRFTDSHPILSSVCIAALFALFEFFHTLTFIGVPWGRFAVGQTGALPVIQSASLFGSYFITFIMILFAALVSRALSLSKKSSCSYKKASVYALAALLLFSLNFAYGCLKLYLPENEENEITVAALQGNIRFEDKWSGKAEYTMETYLSLSKKAAEDNADLIVWPETALPYDISESPELYEYLESISCVTDRECIVTAFETSDERLYNTARLSSPDTGLDGTVYKKRHLVPFGEYVPMAELIERFFPPLAELSSAMDGITPGDGANIIETKNGTVGCLICFDSVYESLSLESVRNGAQLLCISTNDSWFSKSCALRQHNAQAQLRAVETGRYTVRAANTGISSVISPNGELIETLGDNKEGYITAKAAFRDGTTLYTAIGNAPLVIAALYILFCTGLSIFENKKRVKINDRHNNS